MLIGNMRGPFSETAKAHFAECAMDLEVEVAELASEAEKKARKARYLWDLSGQVPISQRREPRPIRWI